MFATAALMLAACSNDGEVAVNDGAAQLQSGSGAVGFDIYTSSATKAGDPVGVMNTEKLKTADKGFGVYAFYQDGVDYTTSLKPNFMFNEHVYWNNGWTYSPLKYWPNETQKDMLGAAGYASSTHKDKLSFFAYAPYVNLTAEGDMWSASDGRAYIDDAVGATGIVGITRETIAGDPQVKWKFSDNLDNNVDLLWGVAPAGMSYTDVSGETSSAAVGFPLLNMVKPDKDQKMKFLFQHALSRLSLSVVSAIDQIAAGDDAHKYTTDDTRVLIEEVKIWGDFGTIGVLNLNNTASNVAKWDNLQKSSSTEGSPLLTIDASTGYLADDLRYDATQIADVAAAGDAAALTTAFTAVNEGVLPSEKTLLNVDGSSNPRYFMVVPSALPATELTKTTINVKITYHVVTKDIKLTGNASNVTNAITKQTKIQLENGKSYNLKLILGLTSVKLDATVADWQVADDAEINLPKNED